MPPAATTVPDADPDPAPVRDGEPGAAGRPRRARDPRLLAPAGAGLLTALVFALATALARSHPLGPYTRNVVDLGQQYLPYHAYWRAFLLGDTHGDALLNWNSGFGANFLGDIGTYLSSPFALLVVLFPADRPELALYVITALKITAAGAAMAALLVRIRPADRPGAWPLAALLGAAYALSGWTFNHGASVPMWLDGLIAFPLLCLVAEWARTGRRPLLGPLVVALAWAANFYTAYMATLGAALFLAVRLLTTGPTGPTGPTAPTGQAAPSPARWRLAALLRAARSVGIGVGLAAPLVLVVFRGTKYADPTPVTVFAPASWTELLGRLLPATANVNTPALFIGTPALALALTLPFNRAVAPRVRYAWSALAVLVTLSLQWEPTHLLWHAGASPNGNPYRQTFVLCGLLLIAAWLSAAPGPPRPPALLGAAALLAALALAARTSTDIDGATYPAFGAAALIALAAVLLLRRAGTAPRRSAPLAAGAAVLLLAAQAGETAVGGARIEARQRAEVSWSPRIGPWQREVAAETARADAWPAHRTDPGELPGGNEPLLVGGEGAEVYSSLTTEATSRTLDSLGFGHYAKGRHPVTLDNPVTDALFSIGTRIRSVPAGPVRQDAAPRAAVTAATTPVPPLVTVHPARDARIDPAASAFRNQELLLGSSVYTLPAVRRDGTVLTARCPAGTALWFWAPEYHGTAALDGGAPVAYDGRPPAVRAPMAALGTVPAGGEVRVTLAPAKKKVRLPRQSVGCLDPARLTAAVARLTATGATRVTATGHTISAELPPGSTGTAVVAVPRTPGWRCAAGDAEPVPARAHRGLLAVPLDGSATRIGCSYRPPGLRLGAAAGAAALLALLATALLTRRTRRRAAGTTGGRQEFTGGPHEARPAGRDADYAPRRTGA
ncbi:YfhO family protein [Streptomyces termitum]